MAVVTLLPALLATMGRRVLRKSERAATGLPALTGADDGAAADAGPARPGFWARWADLAVAAPPRWPRFAPTARQAGFAAVLALPMRLREQVIGAPNLFRADAGALAPAGIRIGQALADVATISLPHERSMRHGDTLNEQLQTVLDSRVIIEQAKGKLAERLGVYMDQAFSRGDLT
jgi:ANTAR domain